MIEVDLFIPLADNDGETFLPVHHDAFEASAMERFGGISRLPGQVAGKWSGGGKVYTDQLVIYRIALGSIIDGGKLGEVVAFAKAHYRQEAIYVSYMGMAEIL